MRIAVIGLGYVGTVTSACLAEDRHTVVGVDISQVKVSQICAGESTLSERDVPDLVSRNVGAGRLSASDDLKGTVAESDVVIVCVGTPTGANGDVHLDDVLRVTEQIGQAMSATPGWRLVVFTSTVPPGTVDGVLLPLLEQASGMTASRDFGVVFAPEFLREGTAVADFRHPVLTVIGAQDELSASVAAKVLGVRSEEIVTTSIAAAESIKFAANSWHALKVAFSNEIGRFCSSLGVDSQEVMRIFALDDRLNISAAYLKPGFAFGGSCLPKDVRTLVHRAHQQGTVLPVIESLLPSNRAHLELALERVVAQGGRRVAVLGLAFKSGTDDLRESPALELTERLIGKGYEIAVHDEHVSLARLIGVNRTYVLERLPHIAQLLHENVATAIEGADVIVVAQGNRAYARVVDMLQPGQVLVDLTGVARPTVPNPQYIGLVW